MVYPVSKWDLIPVYGVYMTAPGDTPVQGNVQFKLSQRVTRTDGRTIYPDGARVQVTIGNPDDQDATVRAAVRSAWRAADQAAQGEEFDAAEWDIWWDTKVLPAAIFTGFPASDDPDILQRDWTVTVTEALTGANGRSYAIQPLMAHLDTPIPGINLGAVEVPPGSPTVPAPVYAKGIAGGVAALDADGDVVDASGEKVTGGGGGDVASVNGQTGAVTLDAADVGAKPADYEPDLSGYVETSDARLSDARTPLAHDHSIAQVTGLQSALNGKAGTGDIPSTPADIGAATAAQGAKADTAVQPADLSSYVPESRTVAGKPLSGDVTLAKGDVGLNNVNNTSDANKPISTATQNALDEKVGSSNASVSGVEYYPSVDDLPVTGVAGVLYFVDAE